jgi:phosphoribosylanthranilate isomerase
LVKVKICGVTRTTDALAACDYGADLIGLNFYPRSPRCVGFERAAEIRQAIRGRAMAVGVFVNPRRSEIQSALEGLELDALQIYADNEPQLLAGWPVPVIEPVSLREETDVAKLQRRAQMQADNGGFVLLDKYDPVRYGGTGMAINLELVRQLDLCRCFVAGGLRPETVGVVAALRPYAVDVASGVESAPGVKDPAKLRSFIENAKSAR